MLVDRHLAPYWPVSEGETPEIPPRPLERGCPCTGGIPDHLGLEPSVSLGLGGLVLSLPKSCAARLGPGPSRGLG